MNAVEGRCRVEVTDDGRTKVTGVDEHMAGIYIVVPRATRQRMDGVLAGQLTALVALAHYLIFGDWHASLLLVLLGLVMVVACKR